MSDPEIIQPITAAETALAIVVNVVAGRLIAERFGLPPWLGGTVASVGMVLGATEPRSGPLWNLGRVLSYPGTAAVVLLRSDTVRQYTDNVIGGAAPTTIDAESESSEPRWTPGKG